MKTTSPNREGLRFFGRVSASVSHEIKNVFAVINEAAGLIEDFTVMAERGMPLQPERLKKAANSIQGQIRRGDGIVKNMNAFAHSTDEDVREVDLPELLELTVALSGRMADMQQIGLTAGPLESATLSANPFDLMRLLRSSIATVLDSMESGDALTVGVRPAPEDGAIFSFAVAGKAAPRPVAESLVELAAGVGLDLTVNFVNDALEMSVRTAGAQ